MTRQDFKQITYTQRRITDLKLRRKELEAAAEQVTIKLSGMPSSHSDIDKMAAFAAEVDEIDRKILEETVKLERLRLAAEEVIDSLPVQQKTVMHLRYVQGRNWYKVAKESNYSIQHCHRIEQAALENLKDATKCDI